MPFYEIKIMTKVIWIILENNSFKGRRQFVIKYPLPAPTHWVTPFNPPAAWSAMLTCLRGSASGNDTSETVKLPSQCWNTISGSGLLKKTHPRAAIHTAAAQPLFERQLMARMREASIPVCYQRCRKIPKSQRIHLLKTFKIISFCLTIYTL